MKTAARIFGLLGSLAVLASIVFAIVSHEPPGSAMLAVLGMAMLYIGWELNRGANTDQADKVEAKAKVGPEHVVAPSWWPAVMALAVFLIAIGIGFSPIIAAIGGAVFIVAALGWFRQRIDSDGVDVPSDDAPVVEDKAADVGDETS